MLLKEVFQTLRLVASPAIVWEWFFNLSLIVAGRRADLRPKSRFV